MNKIKKYIVDLLLAPITLLYQKVLDLEATIRTMAETIARLTSERDHLEDQCRMMSDDLAEAGDFRAKAQSLTVDEQILQQISGKVTHDQVIEILRVGLHIARDKILAWKSKHDRVAHEYQLALGSVQSMTAARDFHARRVQVLESVLAQGFGASARHLLPDEHTIEAYQDLIEFIDKTLVDGEAPPLSDFIDEDDFEAIRVHVSTLVDWFNKHTHPAPTGPTEPTRAPSFTPPKRPAEPIVAQFLGTNENDAACTDAGYCHHKCGDGPCFRREACAPLSAAQLEDDWTPQPQLSDRIIEQAMVHYGAGVPRGVFSAASYARAYCEIVGTKRTLDGNECRRHLARRADVEKMIGGSHFRYTGTALRLPGEPEAKVMSFAEIAQLPEKEARVTETILRLREAKDIESLMALIKEGVDAGVFTASHVALEAFDGLDGYLGQSLAFLPLEEPQDAPAPEALAPIGLDVDPTTIRPREETIASVNGDTLMVSEPTLYRNGEQLPHYVMNPDACHLALSNLDADDECPVCKLRACEHRNWIETERRRGRAQ